MYKKIIAVILFFIIFVSFVSINSQRKERQPDSEDTLQDLSDASTSSGYFLSIGKLSKSIKVSSNQKASKTSSQDDLLSISNNKLIYPSLEIESVCMCDDAQAEHSVKVDEKEINILFNILKSTDCTGGGGYGKDDVNFYENTYYGLQAYIVAKTGDNTYITMNIVEFKDNTQCIYFYEDDNEDFAETISIQDNTTKEQYEYIVVQSKQISELLKSWIEWEEGTYDDLDNISKIVVVDYENKTTILTQSKIDRILPYLKKSILDPDIESYVDSYTLLCDLKDGRTIKIGLQSDGNVIFEGSYYTVDIEVMDKIISILEED